MHETFEETLVGIVLQRYLKALWGGLGAGSSASWTRAARERATQRTTVTEPPEQEDAVVAAAQRRAKRYVAAAFVTFAAIFVGASGLQLVGAVFGTNAPVRGETPAPLSRGSCAQSLLGLSRAVERAIAVSLHAADEAHALETFSSSLSPEWDREKAVESGCAAEPRGRDAYAAVLRLRRAGEGFARRQVVELAPLRRDVAAYLLP